MKSKMFAQALLVPAVLAAFAASAHAGAITWSNAAADGNMATGINWVGGVAPATTDSMVFGYSATTALTNNLASATTVGLIFAADAGAYTISGSTGITVTNGANSYVVNNSTNLQTIATGVTSSSSALWTTRSGGGDIAITGIFSGAGAFTKQGLGVLTLSGNNTVTGGTLNLTTGKVLLDFSTKTTPSNLLAASTTLTFSTAANGGSKGELALKGKAGAVTTQTMSGNVTAGGGGSTISIDNNGATSTTLTLGNAWTRDVATTTAAAGTLNIDLGTTSGGVVKTTAAITGTGALANGIAGYATVRDSTGKTGFATQDGSFNLVRYTAGTALADGTQNSATNYKLDSGSLSLTTGTHTMNSLSVDTTGGATVLDLGASNLSFTSGAILMDGTSNLTITNGSVGTAAAALMIHQMGTGTMTLSATLATTSGSVTKNGGGTLIVTGANTNTGLWDLREGVVSIGAANNLGVSTNGVTFNGGTLQVTGNVALSNNIVWRGGRGTLDVTSGNTLTIASAMTAVSGQGADRGLNKIGAGTLALTASNSGYTGSTSLLEGTILAGNDSAFGSGSINLNGGTIASSSTNARTLTNSVVIGGNITIGLAAGGTGALVFSNVDLGTSTRALAVNNASTTFAGVVSNSGGITKSGAGTLTLAGVNTYSGATTISAGTLQVGNGGTSGSISSTSGVTNNATLAYNRSDDITASYAISGTGALIKNGAGTLTLTNNNTYSGSTTVSVGTLNLNRAGGPALGSTTNVSIASGAKLLLSQSSQVNNTNAAVTLSGGTITRASGVSEVFGNLDLTTGSFLDFGSTAGGSLSFGTYAPSSLLTVQNFMQGDTLIFKSDLGTTITNTSYFQFSGGFTSSWNSGSSTFTITAVPEASTMAAAVVLLALFGYPFIRRLGPKTWAL